jgi:eukaryotic-like serine/threonine-protein kinase
MQTDSGPKYLASYSPSDLPRSRASHRSMNKNSYLGPMSHLQLARAHALQGDIPRARGAYQDFLTLWKDADLPILKQAKTEYAKLQ